MTAHEFGKQPKRQLLQALIPSLPPSEITAMERFNNFQREKVNSDQNNPGYAFLNIDYSDGMLEIQAIHNQSSLRLVCTRESLDEADGPPRYQLSLIGVGTYNERLMRPKITKAFFTTPKEPDESRITPARIEAVITALSHMTQCLIAGQMPDAAITAPAFDTAAQPEGAKLAPSRRIRAGHLKHLQRHRHHFSGRKPGIRT